MNISMFSMKDESLIHGVGLGNRGLKVAQAGLWNLCLLLMTVHSQPLIPRPSKCGNQAPLSYRYTQNSTNNPESGIKTLNVKASISHAF